MEQLVAWKQRWQEITSYIYLAICLFDFLIMPFYYVVTKPSTKVALEMSLKFDSDSSRITAFQILQAGEKWDPVTTKDGSMFHLAFGAILGAASLTKKERITRPQV
jgi:hypothetical protein